MTEEGCRQRWIRIELPMPLSIWIFRPMVVVDNIEEDEGINAHRREPTAKMGWLYPCEDSRGSCDNWGSIGVRDRTMVFATTTMVQ